MSGYIEVTEDSLESMLENLHKVKSIICKMIENHLNMEYEDYEPRRRRRSEWR